MSIFLIIVAGQGVQMTGVTIDQQEADFVSAAWNIAKTAARVDSVVDLHVRLLVPERREKGLVQLNDTLPKEVAAKLPISSYASVKDILSKAGNGIDTRADRVIVAIAGHGGRFVANGQHGVVQMTEEKGAAGQITAEEISTLHPDVYFGLHCHAGYMVNDFDSKVCSFGISGDDVGQNADVIHFSEQDENKNIFAEFLQRFAEYAAIQEKEHFDSYQSVVKKMQTNNPKSSLKLASVMQPKS